LFGTAKRGRGRPKVMPEETQRKCIVEAARKLFMEKGYGNTTTEDIAAPCRISKHTLYRIFAGKAAMFAAVIEASTENILALPGQYDGLSLNDALERIFKIDTELEADHERGELVRLLVVESPRFPEIGAIAKRYGYGRAERELADWLQQQSSRGLIEIDDALNAARILWHMIVSPIVFAAIGDRRSAIGNGPNRKRGKPISANASPSFWTVFAGKIMRAKIVVEARFGDALPGS
jgi:TetR/AcrR family transcriptional regulator, mexJK operon transcriptional repressor